jgi:hypothetical protein
VDCYSNHIEARQLTYIAVIWNSRTEMSKLGVSVRNYDSQGLTDKKHDRQFHPSSSTPIFILCDTCYWCATLIRLEYQWIISVLSVVPIIVN